MHLHRIGAQRTALMLAIVMIMCEIPWVSTQCRTVTMDAHTSKCRLSARARRATERLDLRKHDEKSMRQEAPDHTKLEDDSASHGVPHKRQLPMLELTQMALPIVTKAMEGASKVNGLGSGLNKQHSGLELIEHGFGLPESPLSANKSPLLSFMQLGRSALFERSKSWLQTILASKQ